MNYLKVFFLIILFGVIYFFYLSFLRPSEIVKIYQNTEYSENWKRDCKSTIALVDNSPIGHYGMMKLWKENSEKIIKQWDPFIDECDNLLFVKNKIGRINNSYDTKYWIADDEICLKGLLGGCIAWDDRLFYVEMGNSISGTDVVGMIKEKPLYLNFIR